MIKLAAFARRHVAVLIALGTGFVVGQWLQGEKPLVETRIEYRDRIQWKELIVKEEAQRIVVKEKTPPKVVTRTHTKFVNVEGECQIAEITHEKENIGPGQIDIEDERKSSEKKATEVDRKSSGSTDVAKRPRWTLGGALLTRPADVTDVAAVAFGGYRIWGDLTVGPMLRVPVQSPIKGAEIGLMLEIAK